MLESTNFTLDNINSDDKGVVLVNTSSGLFQETFIPNRTLVETTLPYNDVRILKRVAREPLSFPLTFYIEQWRNWNNLRDIARWFDADYYREFWTEADPERVYFIIVEGASDLYHNGCKDGYVTLTFRSLYPYALSPEYQIVGTATEDSPYSVDFDNAGDGDIRPVIKIRKIGNGDIRILDERNNKELIVTDLLDGEIVEIDCNNELIKSSLEEIHNRYLFDKHNEVWLEIPHQDYSQYEFIGDFEFEITYRLIYKQETV